MGLKKTKNHDMMLDYYLGYGIHIKCSCGFIKVLGHSVSIEKASKVAKHHRKEALDKQFPLNPPKAERS